MKYLDCKMIRFRVSFLLLRVFEPDWSELRIYNLCFTFNKDEILKNIAT